MNLTTDRAQGVAIAAAIARDIPIAEYAPLTIKQSVTGSGSVVVASLDVGDALGEGAGSGSSPAVHPETSSAAARSPASGARRQDGTRRDGTGLLSETGAGRRKAGAHRTGTRRAGPRATHPVVLT